MDLCCDFDDVNDIININNIDDFDVDDFIGFNYINTDPVLENNIYICIKKKKRQIQDLQL
jgi:hypothetical protein